MSAGISDDDFRHMEAFPQEQKVTLMRKIMSRPSAETMVLTRKNDFERAILRLHRDGFGLIDLQTQETACATVWYRKKPKFLKSIKGDVAMLLLEAQEHGEAATLITWDV